MPPLGLLVGGVDFQALVLRLSGAVVIRYGAFLNTVVNFVYAPFAMFLVVRGVAAVQHLRRRETATEAAATLPPPLQSPYSPKSATCWPPRGLPPRPNGKIGRGQSPYKVRPADQNLRTLQAALYLAQKVGTRLGERALLLGALPQGGQTRVASGLRAGW